MKKVLIVILGLCLLAGCAPKGMSSDTFRAGVDALKIVDRYLSGEVDSFDAGMEVSTVHERIELIYVSEYGKPEKRKTLDVRSKVIKLTNALIMDSDISEIKTLRNELAALLNKAEI